MVIIGVVRDEVERNMLLANKLRNEMFDIKKDVKVLEKRIEMQLMMINNDQNEDVILKEDAFKRNCEVYDDDDGDDDVVGPNWPYVEGLCPVVIFVLLHVGVACIHC